MTLDHDGPIIEIGPDGIVRDVTPRQDDDAPNFSQDAQQSEADQGATASGLGDEPVAVVVKRRGGPRPGSGRPRKTEVHEAPIAAAERRIGDHLPEVIDSLLELALGVTVEEPDGNGGVRVYRRPPNYRACSYLIDRVMGKPTDKREVTGAVAVATLGELLQQRDARAKGRRGA